MRRMRRPICLQQSAKVGTDGRFICSRCVGLARERGGTAMLSQLQEIARQAEVNWCPNLRIKKMNEGSSFDA